MTPELDKLFPDKTGWYDEYDFELVEKEKYVAKVGDIVRYIGDSGGTHKHGDITTITFTGEHMGKRKVMTPELDLKYPCKGGFEYDKNFELVEAQNITREHLEIIRNKVCSKWVREIDEALRKTSIF